MIANTTQDSAGIPWNSVQDRREKGVQSARAVHGHGQRRADDKSSGKAGKDPARPFASTSLNWLQLEKISMQRLKTSTRDGKRNGGKISDAICQMPATTTNGKM